jgi:hypothetical protein
MTKTVYMTRGPFAGRYMDVEDDVADRAKADGWARDSMNPTEEEEKAEAERQAKLAESGEPDEHPDSLKEWAESLSKEPEPEGDDTGEAKPRSRRKISGRAPPKPEPKPEDGDDDEEGDDEGGDEEEGRDEEAA